MILTKEIFEKGKSSNGGWNKLQMEALGIEQTKGWAQRIIGQDFPRESLLKFVELKDYHFKNKNPQNLKKKVADRMGIVKLQFEPVLKQLSYSDEYLHPNWQKMRLWVLNRDNYTCVDCKSKDKTLHVHHLKYIFGKHIWEVPHWYLVTLCEDCHSTEHGRDLKARRTL